MLNSNNFLAECSKLPELGIAIPISIGCRVARGFADLGYEEFYLLPASKLLSIYTAKTSDWQAEHQKFFFVVPDIDQLMMAFEEQKLVAEINNQGSEWLVRLKDQQKNIEKSGQNLVSLLIKSYIELKK